MKTTNGAKSETKRILRMRLRSWMTACVCVCLAGVVVVGCTADQWESMQNWGKPQPKGNRVTQGRRAKDRGSDSKYADRYKYTPPSSAKDTQAGDDDTRAKDVDDRVNRYVRSMDSRYDTSYQGNDFNDKIRRQQDPARESRIRRTAEMSRHEDPKEESPKAQDHRLPKTPEQPRVATPTQPKRAVPESKKDTPETTRVARAGERAPASGMKIPDPRGDDSRSMDKPGMEGEPIGGGRTANRKDRVASAEPVTVQPSALTGSTESRGKVSSNEAVKLPERADDAKADSDVQDTHTPARPPVLKKVEAEAAPEPVMTPVKKTTTEKTKPAPIVPVEPVDTFAKRLADQESLVAKDPNNLREQFTLKMMYLIDGQDEKALAPQEGVDAELQSIMRAQIEAMIAARSTAGRDPATWATRQQEALKKLNNLLESRADLRVPVVALCRSIERYGNYEQIEPLIFPAGRRNLVLVYAEVENFKTEKTPSGKCRSLMSARLSLLNKTGEELWSTRTDNFEDYSMRPRRDFFFNYGPFAIPKTLPPGEFVLKVEVEDVLAGKINSNSVSFKMVVE